ncbi:TorD/DmsD family molecular chaperone [Rubeoparvulum massiliense]|uniref:TorD/DmsD family molecular chaperone n=1 Tax=Rubeoparvulum massiliense TaxID=1631346 RepID=UPI00065E735F|nr:molecular chaperone TorD family protein [Rubeoparvulum massiliense]
MENNMDQRKEAASEVILIFAEMFKLPEEEFVQQMKSGEVDEELRRLFSHAGYGEYSLNLSEYIKDYSSFRSEYIHAFSGIYHPSAQPIESIYKEWTTDPEAEVMLVNQKGYLYGDPALHMKYLFEQSHLEIPDEYQGIPDHLTLILEFLGFLMTEGTDQMVSEFLQDHLDWLPDFHEKMKEVKAPSIYQDVVQLLMEITKKEKQFR